MNPVVVLVAVAVLIVAVIVVRLRARKSVAVFRSNATLMEHIEAVVLASGTPLPLKAIRHRVRRRGVTKEFTNLELIRELTVLERNHHTVRRIDSKRRGLLYAAH